MKKVQVSFLFLIILTAFVPALSQTRSALPLWERKSAPAVILGRYVDWKPGDKSFPPSYWGNHTSLKGNNFPEVTVDSTAGRFTLVWDICYPLKHDFHGWYIMILPGDTVKVEINKSALAAYEAYNKETPRDSITTSKLQELWKKAVRIEGGSFEQLQPIRMKGMDLGYSEEYAQAHLRDTYDEWREACWNEFQDVVKQLPSLNLSPVEEEYRRMLTEQTYLQKLRQFTFMKRVGGIKDKDSLEMIEKEMTFKDPHASELTYYRNITGFYACLSNMRDEGWNYIQANGLKDSPLGRWFKELEEARAMMERAKAMQPVAESELNALSSEFQSQIREVQEHLKKKASVSKEETPETVGSKGIRCELPEGEPQEWLPKIVAKHKDRIVLVDFWATWCGPCLMGMKEMESVKKELIERGVDFVYITNTSSSVDEWQKYIDKHAGDHYIVPKEKMLGMQIPGYESAIPHYLIYDRKGKLAKHIRGWSNVEGMMQELNKIE